MDDQTTHAGFWPNAKLLGAAWADSIVDSPVWLYNKATGASVPDPIDLAATVYTEQTSGQFTSDIDGHVLTDAEIEAGAKSAESQGAILQAGADTAAQAASNPFSIIPGWAIALGVILVALVALFYGMSIYRAVRT